MREIPMRTVCSAFVLEAASMPPLRARRRAVTISRGRLSDDVNGWVLAMSSDADQLMGLEVPPVAFNPLRADMAGSSSC